jgi:hypothetical protein
MEKQHVVEKDGKVDTNQVDKAIQRMGDEKIEEITANFDSFKSYLKDKVELGKKLGLGEEQLAKTAEKVAGYLASNVEPKNREEKLLQELWKVGNEEQQHMLAHMLVRLVEEK